MVSSSSVCMICGYVHGSGECKRGLNFSAPDLTEEKVQLPGQGAKNDKGKLRYDLVPVGPLRKLVEVYTLGASKYEPRNWEKGMAWSRLYAAMMRHAVAFWDGEKYDPVDGQEHLASVAWITFALMEFEETHPELDDRPKKMAPGDGR